MTNYYKCCQHCDNDDPVHDVELDRHEAPCNVFRCVQGKKGSFDMEHYKSEFEKIFGFKEQPWSNALGALILTLSGEPETVDVRRAQNEVQELKMILNKAAGLPVPE